MLDLSGPHSSIGPGAGTAIPPVVAVQSVRSTSRRPLMKRVFLVIIATAGLTATVGLQAKNGEIQIASQGTNRLLRVQAAADAEWRFQTSSDLLTWVNAPSIGAVFSAKTNAPWVSMNQDAGSQGYYRAVKTTGLYDALAVRTLRLTFTQSAWQTLLASGRTTGSNTLATLEFDGQSYPGVGVRYRGNTSYSGLGAGGAPTKKSLNIEMDYTNATTRLRGYKTLNLNNAYTDESLMREPLYFNVMRQYTVCPHSGFARLYINDQYWGLYCLTQQEDGDLIKEYFPSTDGDRWRAPNMGGGGGGFPGGGGGGGAPGGSGNSALGYLGTRVATYQSNYQLKSDNSTNAWERLMHATDVLNNTPAAQLRDAAEDVLAVDRWLWFLAIENLFTDEDSYYFKGADYGFYYEPESGRIHPVEHDGNETCVAADVSLSPVQGAASSTRPVLYRLLGIAELRQRYLAHLRTVLEETFNPATLLPVINEYSALTIADIVADTKKNYTMTAYTNDLSALRSFVQKRYVFLTNHAELKPVAPTIVAVYDPVGTPSPLDTPYVRAEVRAVENNGLDSVWLYHRGAAYGKFARNPMFDDGLHGDGAANDGVFGGGTAPYPAGAKVRYYVEARSANSAKAACFAPARAEEDTYGYRVGLITATNTPVVINELLASNQSTLADPQGEFDDWIELRNLTDQAVNLTGRYLTDEPNDPRKRPFPDGTVIPANGFLLIWADEDRQATDGLHANFKLSASGEQVFLIDTDTNLNAVLDSVTFGAQEMDRSYGRAAANADVFTQMVPTPGAANH